LGIDCQGNTPWTSVLEIESLRPLKPTLIVLIHDRKGDVE